MFEGKRMEQSQYEQHRHWGNHHAMMHICMAGAKPLGGACSSMGLVGALVLLGRAQGSLRGRLWRPHAGPVHPWALLTPPPASGSGLAVPIHLLLAKVQQAGAGLGCVVEPVGVDVACHRVWQQVAHRMAALQLVAHLRPDWRGWRELLLEGRIN